MWYAVLWNGWNLPPYEDRCKLIDIDSLERWRTIASLTFMFDLFMGKIDALDIRNAIQLNEPSRTLRTHLLFKIKKHKTNYGMNEPLNRLTIMTNKLLNFRSQCLVKCSGQILCRCLNQCF